MSDDSDDEPVIADSQQQKLQTEVNTEKLKKTGRPKKAKKEDSYESYEAKDIKCFLEYVENAPILWDASIDNSHRKEFKWHHYEEIEHVCRKFMPKGRRIGETAERLFVELKRDYDRHLRSVQNAKSGSGVVKNKFEYAENMRFLDGALHKRTVKK
uniref:MADF domain-containing protein n=1 Tax=Caenorhabditis japonica TaxID=281687 RepID=A0A8R1HPI5_CAEJA